MGLPNETSAGSTNHLIRPHLDMPTFSEEDHERLDAETFAHIYSSDLAEPGLALLSVSDTNGLSLRDTSMITRVFLSIAAEHSDNKM